MLLRLGYKPAALKWTILSRYPGDRVSGVLFCTAQSKRIPTAVIINIPCISIKSPLSIIFMCQPKCYSW